MGRPKSNTWEAFRDCIQDENLKMRQVQCKACSAKVCSSLQRAREHLDQCKRYLQTIRDVPNGNLHDNGSQQQNRIRSNEDIIDRESNKKSKPNNKTDDEVWSKWAELEHRVKQNIVISAHIITLDVGGTIFKTARENLLSIQGTHFHALLGSGLWKPETPDKAYFLDLDPLTFHHIMTYLRTGKLSIEDLCSRDRENLQYSLDFLHIKLPSNISILANQANQVENITSILPIPVKWTWSSDYCPRGVTLLDHNRTVEVCDIGQWVSAVSTVPRSSFRVRIDSFTNETCIGFTPHGFENAGFSLRIHSGHLRGPTGSMGRRYTTETFSGGDILGVCTEGGNLSFQKNGRDLGVAFIVSSDTQLYPFMATFYSAKITILIDEF